MTLQREVNPSPGAVRDRQAAKGIGLGLVFILTFFWLIWSFIPNMLDRYDRNHDHRLNVPISRVVSIGGRAY